MNSKKKKQDQPKTAGNGDQTAAASTWNDELMTTKQLMKLLQISRTKAWELVMKEGLPAFKIGGDYRYRRSEVLSWMEKYRVKNT